MILARSSTRRSINSPAALSKTVVLCLAPPTQTTKQYLLTTSLFRRNSSQGYELKTCVFAVELHISEPSKIESCDNFFNIAAPLINVKLLEHLQCLNLVCHCSAFSSVTIKRQVGFWENPVQLSSVTSPSVSSSSGPASSQTSSMSSWRFGFDFILRMFKWQDTYVRQMRTPVRSGIHSMWWCRCFTSRLPASGPKKRA